MERRLLLNVVVGQGATVFQLLPSENQALLIRRNSFLVLNLRLDVIDGVRRLHLQSDGLPREGLDEDLHAPTETEDEMKGGLLLDVIVGECPTILELFAGKNQTLLVGRDPRVWSSVDGRR